MSRSQQPSTADIISYLYERPSEPIFTRKGGDGTVQFNVPESYYLERYRPIIQDIETKGPAASVTIQVKNLTSFPDITLPMSLPLRENFSVFSDFHRSCAVRLIEVFLEPRTIEDFIATTAYCHDRVNSYLYIYALSVALLHRPDTRNIPLPSHVQSFPELYMDKAIFSQAREEENIVPDGSRMPIDIPRDYTATDLDLEHRVAYFREDVGINLHHWHWHLVYPLDGRLEIVRKDRRGELFYYMHEQILARYNAERLCNQLNRVKRFLDFRDRLEEGYFSKLDSLVASRNWPPRPANTYWSNLNRESDQLKVDIQDLERWRDRLYECVHTGRYIVPGSTNTVAFTPETGIDILGNMIESSILSVNRNEYGNMHNMGHLMIAYCHDPENHYLETFGVMGDSSTAMRDPAFYRWHAFVNDLFEEYKHTLPPYTVPQLQFENLRITGVQISSTGIPNNQIATFWQQAEIDLSRGLDFAESRGPVFARVTHLQHAPFTYTIAVQNSSNSARTGTVRIFYAPRFTEGGIPFLYRDQKSLFIELDRFVVNLQRGNNTITRRSDQSSVTIPYEQTFRNLANRPAAGSAAEAAYNFCGCGWPQHMLICKGTLSGFPCQLFVMISDQRNDAVTGAVAQTSCDDASSYCGIRDSVYPDRQPMGFPFDRLPRTNVLTTQQFLTPNMFLLDFTVQFRDRVVAPIQNQPAQPTRRP